MRKADGFLIENDDGQFLVNSEMVRKAMPTVRAAVAVFELTENLHLMEELEIRVPALDINSTDEFFVIRSLEEARDLLTLLTTEVPA